MMLPVDYFMNIKTLSRYSGISVRKIKDLIRHPDYPLPAYKVGGSIKIKKSEFETWLNKFRLTPEKSTNVNEIVNDVMLSYQSST
jgi:excisionase family DNA binding protein